MRALLRRQLEPLHGRLKPCDQFSTEERNTAAVNRVGLINREVPSHDGDFDFRIFVIRRDKLQIFRTPFPMFSRVCDLLSGKHPDAIVSGVILKSVASVVSSFSLLVTKPKVCYREMPLFVANQFNCDPVQRVVRRPRKIKSGELRLVQIFQPARLFEFPSQFIEHVLRRRDAKCLVSCVNILSHWYHLQICKVVSRILWCSRRQQSDSECRIVARCRATSQTVAARSVTSRVTHRHTSTIGNGVDCFVVDTAIDYDLGAAPAIDLVPNAQRFQIVQDEPATRTRNGVRLARYYDNFAHISFSHLARRKVPGVSCKNNARPRWVLRNMT